jgi:uncharacterized membrane-anchored protein
MIELLRLTEVQRVIAFLMALGSFCYTYHRAVLWSIADTMRRAPHDGQAGLGALFMGLMIGVPVAALVYFLSMHWMQAWEKRYAQKLDEEDRIAGLTTPRT